MRSLGRRGFVAGALLTGSVAAAGYGAARATAADGRPAVPAGATVLTGPGVDPTGADDSTAALQDLVDSAPEGAWLWLPAGTYLVDGLALRPGQMLTGPSARSYLGAAGAGARLQARSADQTGPVLLVGEFGRVADISVAGQDRRQPAVRPAGLGVVLERVTMTAGSVGYDAMYASGSVLTACLVHENGIGLKDLVDSMVAHCVINANAEAGISLGAGANDNSFVGNKVEWNDGEGISAYQALHNTIVGGVLDRNGRAGVRLVECQHSCLVGAVLRRNGRLAQDSPDDDCHVFSSDGTGIVVSGIVTNSGPDDDDTSGYRSPSVAIRHSGGTAVGYSGNDLSGRTSEVAIARAGAATEGAVVAQDAGGLNLGVGGVQLLSGTRVRVLAGELDVSAGGTAELTADLGAFPTGAPGRAYRLDLVSADAATGAAGLAQATVLVSRAQGEARADLGPVEDRLGSAFAAAGGTLQLAVDVSADGAALTVRIRNTGRTAAGVGVELV